MTEEEYRELPNSEYFSASFLKMFDKEGPESLIKKIDYNNKGTFKGSIIDTLCFDNENFEKIYHVSTSNKEPSETEKVLLNSLHSIIDYKDIKSFSYIKVGLNLIKELKLWKNIKNEEILISKLKNEDFVKSLKDLFKSKNKIVISGSDYMNALEVKKYLIENENTKDYFLNSDIKKKQVLFQIPILFSIENDKFKSLLDIIFIDHEDKTIRVVDLKTGFDDNNSFKWTILKYRYDIQIALYTKALETYIIDNGLKDYRVIDPMIIYTQVSKPDRPLIFKFNESLVRYAYIGFKLKSGYLYKGILELVDEINWHKDNNIYNYSKNDYINKQVNLDSKLLNIDYGINDMPSDLFSNYSKSNSYFNTDMLREMVQDLTREPLITESWTTFARSVDTSSPGITQQIENMESLRQDDYIDEVEFE